MQNAKWVVGRLVLVSWLSVSAALAAPGEPAVTKLNDVDEDFSLMGEYLGVLGPDQTTYGLQVVALGAGQFRAVLLEGGLPGSGWDRRRSRQELEGTFETEVLSLHGTDVTVTVQGQVARVQDESGTRQGTLGKVVRRSALQGLRPVNHSIVLFDGKNTSAFKDARVVDGLLQVGTDLIPTFRNFHLHVEFMVPYMPHSRSQARANSGVYLQSRYEVQILDSFGLDGKKNECGGLYKQRAPDINMAFPPLSWQTYDITFHAPRFDVDCQKTANARLTVLHNGVVIHDDISVVAKTGAGKPEGPNPLPIRFQDHSNPVQFRNIWLKPLPR